MPSTAAESCRCGGGRRAAADGRLQIAVGVVLDPAGARVLLAKRRPGSEHAGLWEFPGGKCRPGERLEDALRRELLEEISVIVGTAEPLLCVDYDYPGRAVRLHVWRISGWSGAPSGREGQDIEWVPIAALRSRRFPEANRTIVAALTLPRLYVITPDLDCYDAAFFGLSSALLDAGARLLQFRSKRLPEAERPRVIGRLAGLCHSAKARLVVNGSVTEVLQGGANGLHLTSSRLLQTNARPLDREFLVGASCHNRMELEHAARLGVDFAALGPVQRTRTHPEAEPLGWRRFRELVTGAGIPVYALGGVGPADMAVARQNGAHGLAMIGGIWSAGDPAAAVAACLAPDNS
jgi:8-oxo-dGTP diphosphatase